METEMPLTPGKSKEVISKNIREFHTGKTFAHTSSKFGKDRANAQAVAVALNTARKYAGGGEAPFFENQAFRQSARAGMIHSAIPGRTDKIPMSVNGGSHILPADVVSGIGQGNSTAGAVALNKLFKMGPYGSAIHGSPVPHVNFGHPGGFPKAPTMLRQKFSPGGTPDHGKPVDIIAAGGEYTVPPEVVSRIGGGNMQHGHDVLDAMILHLRKKTIKDMQGLKPPKKS
jgi:hypothetical protein